ncbi:solute carrier family 23 member 3 isoform X1 [Alligator mississippiensis]|uniref:Solute carrier family 23 member 3 isoform A n=1 Tax=Alligator mississippiensis TaxID=8496 RepID=A0A151NBY5_ALLMI|nr:solute carrier family 23 member 3 isoform X1 [Alligator mississippiensis]KYO34297.1 solute carrier family 23 member 3 isoform A [Alligator mississippiensis]
MPGGCCQGPHAPPLPAAPTDRPPWALSCAFALQHVAVQASLLCVFHLLLLPTFPPADPDLLLDPSRDRGALLAQSLFACGASSMLQTVLGTRLPLLHVPTFEFLIPAVVLSTRLPHPGSNGTDTPAPCTGPSCSTGGWDRTAREVSGAVVVAGLVQLALGLSGAGGWAARHCGPLVLAPTLSIMGLSAYKPAAAFCSASWSLALLLVLLAVLCSQHLGSCRLPRCTETRTPGFPVGTAIPALRRFSVLLPFAIAWLVCGVLAQLHVPWAQLSPVLPNATTPPPWLQLPYPGQLGWPQLSPLALGAGLAMGLAAGLSSLGCYAQCGGALGTAPPPPSACSRGLCTEALGSLLAGLLGGLGGSAASIPHASLASLTQAGSRCPVQLAALVCLLLGLSPRLAELLTHIPLPIHGSVLCVTYAVAVGAGISYFQRADIDSGRNVFVVGFTMFMGLLVPRWLGAAPTALATGWEVLDVLLHSLLTVPVVITGILSFVLENTVSGSPQERGLLPPRVQGSEPARVYGLPPALQCPLGPTGLRVFPLCFLCPRPEEEEGGCAVEEGSISPGEATRLLVKAGATAEAKAGGKDREPERCWWPDAV